MTLKTANAKGLIKVASDLFLEVKKKKHWANLGQDQTGFEKSHMCGSCDVISTQWDGSKIPEGNRRENMEVSVHYQESNTSIQAFRKS